MTHLGDPIWVKVARKYIGLREKKGIKHNAKIVGWWSAIRAAWFNDDETPWCGAFVGGVLAECGLGDQIPKNAARALSWVNCGNQLSRPAYGCVVVFTRKGGGHVGFVVGKDSRGNLMVLGGNQGDEVNIKPFSITRVVKKSGYRWPSGKNLLPLDERYNLPLLTSDGKVSTNEA